MTLFSGTHLGPYEILSPLGAGGMGEVYRARDTRLKREVAIKVLPPSYSKDPDRLRRFEQEAQAASALNHPNILAIYDIGSDSDSPYIVSELLEGETLRSRLAGGAFSPRKALGFALQIAHGLAAAHEKGIVHRDLKPENIFVTKDGRIKILDFGLAKLAQSDAANPQSEVPTIGSQPGVALGTLGYMSPEQVRGIPLDPRSDIFSFGVILYEILAGRRAFHGHTGADTMSAILKEEPPDLSSRNPHIAPGLNRVMRHCLEKDPEQRFQSARDLAFDLEALSDVSALTAANPAVGPGRSRRTRTVLILAGVFGLLAAGLWISTRPPVAPIDSLAVLPFTNVNQDPAADYLSEGITEGLINSLSQVPDLIVMSRDSVSGYTKRDTSAQAAGRELNVRAVLKGKFVQRAQTLFISAELVDVRRNSHLWGGQFSGELSDFQTVQEKIAGQISSKLRSGFSVSEKKRLKKRDTENAEAYQLYLKGRYFWEKRTEEALKKSIGYYNEAIERDPAYGRAYAGLSEAYSVAPSWGGMPPKESYPRARAAAKKALEIDDSLAEGHACLGFVLESLEWAWSDAEGEFKRAIALNTNYATAHHWYGLLLTARGRFDEATAELHRARELDPLSKVIQANNARVSLYARHYDRAIEEARKTIELDPTYFNGPLMLGRAHEAKGMSGEAIREYRDAVKGGGGPLALSALGGAYALSGRRVEAQAALEELKNLATRRYVPPYYIATIYQDLGEKDQAFEWLEKAYADCSWDLNFLKVNPSLDSLRSDPRFANLLRRLNLAP